LTDDGISVNAPEWFGRPVALRLGEAQPRQRVFVTGEITGVRSRQTLGPVLEADIDDGSARATLIFLGRIAIPGLEPGVYLTAEATLLRRRNRLELVNPRYSFVPPPGAA
jgi:hypothetical protein